MLHCRVELKRLVEAFSEIVGSSLPEMHDLQNFAENQSGWRQLDGWLEMDDLAILKTLAGNAVPSGSLLIATDLSYSDGLGVFEVDARQLDAFVSSYLSNFGECFFNGDVIICSTSQKAFWMFHHEGATLTWVAPIAT